MMNINLNLLPVVKKNRLEYITNFLLIKDILELIILIGSVLAATLIWGWIFQENDFANLAESLARVDREYYSYNQDIKKLNNLLKEVNLASQTYAPVTPRLKELINSLPNDIKISSLQVDYRVQTLIINGTALTRSALLHYQDTLNAIPWITQVETPASQLFQKENINFEFKAKLKDRSLNQSLKPVSKPVTSQEEF